MESTIANRLLVLSVVSLFFSCSVSKEYGSVESVEIAFSHRGLFSRVGGHSPTLFVGELTNRELAATADIVSLDGIYLDTGPADVNRAGCDELYRRLVEAGAPVEYHVLPGTHGLSYLEDHMAEYLRFYAGRSGP